MIRGCQDHVNSSGPFISVPVSRDNFLVLEAVAQVESASMSYKNKRQEIMALPPDSVDNIQRLLGDLHMTIPDGLGILPYQLEYFCAALEMGRMLNFSEQGTGKTLMNLILAYLWKCQRVMVVCPNSVVPEWMIQHNQWFGNNEGPERFNIWLLEGVDTKDRDKALRILGSEPGRHIAVCNFQVFARLKKAISTFRPDFLCVDESMWVKNPNTQMTKAVTEIAHLVKHVTVNCGTPIGNHVGDLYSQANLVSSKIFPENSYSKYMTRFAEYEVVRTKGGQPLISGGYPVRKVIGCKDPVTLMRVLAPVWFRASKAACLNLPPKRKRRVLIDLSPEECELYNKVEADGEQALGNMLSLNGAMVIALRLQQITSGHAVMFRQQKNTIVQDVVELDSSKLAWLDGWIKDTLSPNPYARCIIWCRFRPEITRIVKLVSRILGANAVAGAGGEFSPDAAELTDIKASFNSRSADGVRVLVAGIDKMHAGHNLQAGDYNIGYSHTWSYIKRAQLEDRTHRLGREDPVDYIDLISRGTIDEQIMSAQDRKEDLAVQLTPSTVSGLSYQVSNLVEMEDLFEDGYA